MYNNLLRFVFCIAFLFPCLSGVLIINDQTNRQCRTEPEFPESKKLYKIITENQRPGWACAIKQQKSPRVRQFR